MPPDGRERSLRARKPVEDSVRPAETSAQVVVRLSVSDVAELANTAPSSVVRACQRLGFRGYQEIKIEAAREAPRPPAPGDGSALAVALSGAGGAAGSRGHRRG
ncbi:hypothetical protein [Kitasatospora sp. NPDC001175]|uniref:hypothetical protein n=1 Tax=Kitasatospora sp. NPDC001175 TaxID=3157103 RepID=UPI003D07E810